MFQTQVLCVEDVCVIVMFIISISVKLRSQTGKDVNPGHTLKISQHWKQLLPCLFERWCFDQMCSEHSSHGCYKHQSSHSWPFWRLFFWLAPNFSECQVSTLPMLLWSSVWHCLYCIPVNHIHIQWLPVLGPCVLHMVDCLVAWQLLVGKVHVGSCLWCAVQSLHQI